MTRLPIQIENNHPEGGLPDINEKQHTGKMETFSEQVAFFWYGNRFLAHS